MAVGLYQGIPITRLLYRFRHDLVRTSVGPPAKYRSVPNSVGPAVAVLVAVGFPVLLLSAAMGRRRSGRFTKLGWLGFGLWSVWLSFQNVSGHSMASWIQSDELTGNGYASPTSTIRRRTSSDSHRTEFAPADIQRAEEASPEVRAYCSASRRARGDASGARSRGRKRHSIATSGFREVRCRSSAPRSGRLPGLIQGCTASSLSAALNHYLSST